ncbi:MAG: adenylate/guanylate cyclase domain-containing protein [Fimbriimonadia bacterium]
MDQSLQFEPEAEGRKFDEQTAERILSIAARLQEREGEKLDEGRLKRIAEEAGVRPEYLALAMQLVDKQAETVKPPRGSIWRRLREPYDSVMGPKRRVLDAGLVGLSGAVLSVLFGDIGLPAIGTVAVIASVAAGCWSMFKTHAVGFGTLAGMAWGGAYGLGHALMHGTYGGEIVGGLMGGALLGVIVGAIGSGSAPIAQAAPAQTRISAQATTTDRQEMLRQLYELQDRLRQGTQNATFLSVDVVGSTQMKLGADPLAVEYSFGAYHQVVGQIVRECGGQVHNTSGDGITAVFDLPERALSAARAIQRAVPKLNAEQNRLATPFSVRCGIHSGAVVAPHGDLRGVEFAHVIDIAAHLQKAAPPGGIVISEGCAAEVHDPLLRLGLIETVVEGVSAHVFPPIPEAPGTS